MSPRPPPPTLRSVLTVSTLLTASIATIASAALVVLTTKLHETTTVLSSALESVRLTGNMRSALLVHVRAADPVVRADVEAGLRRNLERAREYVSTDTESAVFRDVESQLGGCLGVAGDDRLIESCYEALSNLVEINVQQAKAAAVKAEVWDTIGNTLGLVSLVLLLGVTCAHLWWLRRSAFRPVLALSDAMRRFGAGDRTVRASETGPLELSEMARNFNEMASALAAQRNLQMAFLAGIAHDLRNPLAVMHLASAPVIHAASIPSEARLLKTLATVNRQIGRLDRMVGDLLDVARIEAGQLEVVLEPKDVREAVREAVDLVGAGSTEHKIQVALPHERMIVRSDSQRLEQAVANLLSNAIKYSPPGGPIDVEVRNELRGDEPVVVIEVRDHGVGITREDRERLFQPFSRVGAPSSIVPGVGLGLFMVKSIVEGHRGRVEVESTPGRGSTFRLLLPRESAAERFLLEPNVPPVFE